MIDMHMHTVYSDGTNTVEELLEMCENKKLECISITDHDSCRQYTDEAWNKNIFKGRVIKGSELHAQVGERLIEILAYNIDINIIENWLQKYYSEEKLIESQKNSTKMICDIFDKHQIKYNLENVPKPKKATDFVEKPIYNEAMKYEENYAKFGEFVKSFSYFYRVGLTNPESSFYMKPSGKPDFKEVIDIIHKAGGKAFLAHPFEYRLKDTIGFIDSIVKEAKLDGIECFHPSSMDNEKYNILVDYAKINNLFISGGSDYHGKAKPGIELGVGRGNVFVPKEYIDEWI